MKAPAEFARLRGFNTGFRLRAALAQQRNLYLLAGKSTDPHIPNREAR